MNAWEEEKREEKREKQRKRRDEHLRREENLRDKRETIITIIMLHVYNL